jgi:FkbH-like protein
LKALSRELGLALDSFIFIDDDPVECAEARANCPEVLTLQLPQGSDALPGFLEHVWAFDHPAITAEDRRRTALYRQSAQRGRFQKESLTFADFLAGLDLRVDISALSQEEFARASELTYRTNQFNLAPNRRTEADMQTICRVPGTRCLGVRVRDRFGDYGLVGLVVFRTESRSLRVDTFLLSCRAMGKGVEYQMIAKLGRIALELKLDRFELHFVPTAKNRPARRFLQSLGKGQNETFEQNSVLVIEARDAATLQYIPVAEETEDEMESHHADTQSDNASLLSFIAAELRDVDAIHKAIGQQAMLPAGNSADFVALETPLERKIAAVWSDILGIDRIGRTDDFFRLGGHSLLAMQILSRMCDAFEVDLSPNLLFDDFTVAGLAKAILKEQIRQANHSDIEAVLSKLGALSDDEVKVLLDLKEHEGSPSAINDALSDS